MHVREFFLHNINPVIRFLVISDVLIVGAAGLFAPVFALFIAESVQGDETVAGIAAGLYLLSKSILQIPCAHYLDKIRGERDDFWFMFIFSLLAAIFPIFYIFVSTPLELYLVQLLLGFCIAFTYPSFMAIFTRHVDKHKEGTEWSIYFTLIDIVSALLAIIGGYLAYLAGFATLIIVVVIVSVLGVLLLLPIRPYLKKGKR